MRRIALGVIAVALVATACGDDGETLTVDDYFARIAAAGESFADRSQAADAELTESQDPVADAKRIIPEFADILGDFVDVLDGIAPPSEVADAHEAAVAAGKDALADLNEVMDEISDVEDLTGLSELFGGPAMEAFNQAGQRFEESCGVLQGIADDRGLNLDLRCEG